MNNQDKIRELVFQVLQGNTNKSLQIKFKRVSWGEMLKDASPLDLIKLPEYKDKIQERFIIDVKGATPGNKYIVIIGDLSHNFDPMAIYEAGEDGQLFAISEGKKIELRYHYHLIIGFSPGEQVGIIVTSLNSKKGTIIKATLIPLEIDQNGYHLEAQMVERKGIRYDVLGSGYEPFEEVKATLKFSNQEVTEAQIMADEKGNVVTKCEPICGGGMFGGVSTMTFEGKKALPRLI